MPHRSRSGLAAVLASSLFVGAPLVLHAEPKKCIWENGDAPETTIYMMYEFVVAQAGYRPEDIGERKPVLKTLNAKQLRQVGMAEDTAAVAFDPDTWPNNTPNYVMLVGKEGIKKVACGGNEVGWVLAHEAAHFKLRHVSKLKELKKKLFEPWWKSNGKRFAGQCMSGDSKADSDCFAQTIFTEFLKETPEVFTQQRAYELEADAEGHQIMLKMNPSYNKAHAQAVLDKLKDYEKGYTAAPPYRTHPLPADRAAAIQKQPTR